MSINRFLIYSVYIFNVLIIILMLISFYCLFIQFFDLFLYQDVYNFVDVSVSDYGCNRDDNSIREQTGDNNSLCSCSSCTCSNPSINVPDVTFIDKCKNVGKRRIY